MSTKKKIWTLYTELKAGERELLEEIREMIRGYYETEAQGLASHLEEAAIKEGRAMSIRQAVKVSFNLILEDL